MQPGSEKGNGISGVRICAERDCSCLYLLECSRMCDRSLVWEKADYEMKKEFRLELLYYEYWSILDNVTVRQ